MFFRFASALAVVLLVSLAGIAIEKRCLAWRRAISRQRYRQEALIELTARLRLQTQELGAPKRILEALEHHRGLTQLARAENQPGLSRSADHQRPVNRQLP